MSTKAIIKAIDECAVHDGPGNRALVFLKGCDMRCEWCQNVELIDSKPELWFHRTLCKNCGLCKEVCPVAAIDLQSGLKRINKEKCLGYECAKCVKACPNNAYDVVGFEMSAEELYTYLAKYKVFYSSGGGITLTGGDPLYYPDFSAEVLELCRNDNIHTAIESALYSSYENVWKLAKHCDLILCDIKHMDSEKHREGTGVPNNVILENIKRLNVDFKGDIVVRIPLIPSYNDSEENVINTVKFLDKLEKVKGLDLLPFNVFPISKYEALGMEWKYARVAKQSDEYLCKLKELVLSYCGRLRCTVGGLW